MYFTLAHPFCRQNWSERVRAQRAHTPTTCTRDRTAAATIRAGMRNVRCTRVRLGILTQILTIAMGRARGVRVCAYARTMRAPSSNIIPVAEKNLWLGCEHVSLYMNTVVATDSEFIINIMIWFQMHKF